MTASMNTSAALVEPTEKNDNNKVKAVGERTDSHTRNHTQTNNGTFWFCEGWHIDMNMLQDGVCGNVGVLIESRDDETGNNDQIKSITNIDADATESVVDSTIRSLAATYSKDFDVSDRKVGESAKKKQKVHNDADGEKKNPLVAGALLSPSNRARYQHFMALIENTSNAYGDQSLPVADLYVSLGNDLDEEEDKNSKHLALVVYEEAYNIYQAKSGDSDVRTIDCRVRMGKTFLSLGRHDEALESFCQAVYMREALLGELHPSVADVWVSISSVHRARGKLDPALKASAKALTGYRNAHGDKHPTVIDVLRTISAIHTGMGNADKAADIDKYVNLYSKAHC
mmetsp:Transcript_21742/g.45246  ORF Transcript_21742/g.45246 Transcript_21742/m.45246 type:complete len:342 (-) Transcript_21742:18-1043(-)|eukprot:CAMPEP_0171344116 /NCGR_PEP_ID=MMETSP0878-20121228/18670_1 /TAXON_ID=67004 /ORGANISM="Thalassiosira weissflogii, Strain CCMP1336" /LENGTH=341 /DNA_ID=CAMNT_0011847227 /DNA_START=115 /DNA_END=1140 /DNA_ORIENTATION=+